MKSETILVVGASGLVGSELARLLTKEGQKVRIVETRPISKLKRWRVVEVIA